MLHELITYNYIISVSINSICVIIFSFVNFKKGDTISLLVGTESGLGIRKGGSSVGYVRRLRLLALLLVSHLREFFFFLGVCNFDVAVG